MDHFLKLCVYLFLATLGLCCCIQVLYRTVIDFCIDLVSCDLAKLLY